MLRALWSTNVRDVGDVVEKFKGATRVPGVTPRSGVVIVGVGPPRHRPSTSEAGLCYLDAVEPEPRGPALKWCPFACIAERNTCVRSPGPG